MNKWLMIGLIATPVIIGIVLYFVLRKSGDSKSGGNGGGSGDNTPAQYCNDLEGAPCPTGYKCNNFICEKIIDLCADVTCIPPEKCVNGECKSVATPKCMGGVPYEIYKKGQGAFCNKGCYKDSRKYCTQNNKCVNKQDEWGDICNASSRVLLDENIEYIY